MNEQVAEWLQSIVGWLALSLIGLLTWMGKRLHSDVESLKANSAKVESMTKKIDSLDADVRKQLSDQRDRGDASTADYRLLIREVHQKIEATTNSTNGRIDKLAENMGNQHAKIMEMLVSMRNGH